MSDIYTSDECSSLSGEIQVDHLNLSGENTPDFQETGDDANSEVALSIIWQGYKLGAAYFNFDTEHMYLMSDQSEDASTFTVLKLLLKQIEPHFIITSCKSDERIISILKETCRKETSSASTDTSSTSKKLHLLPNINFAYESARHHLQNLNTPNIPPNMSDAERRIYFSSLIDFKSACMIKAAGGLLKFIGEKNMSEFLSVLGISHFSLKHAVNIDENTYRELQIFQSERHPSVYKSSAGMKEGLSLYGITNKCKSTIGKKKLKQWFLLPTNDISVIQERHMAINFFNLSKNFEFLHTLQNSLKHIKYLPKIFTRMKAAQASINDWKTLYQTSYHAMMIGEVCRNNSSSLKILREISAEFSTDLFRIANLLDKIIDFQEYARQNHFAVKPGVDSEIDKMKRLYNGLPDFMTQVAHQELQELHADIQQCTVIYLPQLGYLLTIPMTEAMKHTKDYTLPNLKFMFVLNDTVHYKSARTRKLDSLLGDTLCDIYDKETQIMHKLQNMILEMKNVFFSVMELLAQLDCYIALAVASKEFNWIQPEMSYDGIFEVLKARHPLQELCVPSFVPNDIFSGGSETKIKVLTGPNSSGKSTYLKQVALIAFLAHIGSFVPAQKAKIPLFDSIFSCIENVESISINLSSFFISLNQLSGCLKYSTANSLVVVDEFGKHTEGRSGVALLAATIKFWLEKGSSSPHVFLTTHHLSIKNFLPATPHISFQTIDIIMNEELVYLHQLVDGIATSSYAANTALQAGIPEDIVERSIQITNEMKQNKPISVQQTSLQSQKLNKYLSIYNSFMELNMDNDDDIKDFIKYIKEFSKQ